MKGGNSKTLELVAYLLDGLIKEVVHTKKEANILSSEDFEWVIKTQAKIKNDLG